MAFAAPTRRNLAELFVTREQAVALAGLQERVLGEADSPGFEPSLDSSWTALE